MTSSQIDQYVQTIAILLRDGLTNIQIAEELNVCFGFKTSEASVRRCISRNEDLHDAADARSLKTELVQQASPPGIKHTDPDTIEVTLPLESEFEEVSHLTITKVMARHQLDPDFWECDKVLPNVWQGQRKGGELINFYQFKLFFKKKVPIEVLLPFSPAAIPQRPSRTFFGEPELGVIVTDHQAPHHNEELHELFLRWLSENDPVFGVIGGDLSDFGFIGRHRDDPAWDATGQECIDASGGILWDYIHASATDWTLIKGNHDDRLRNEQLERNERLYGIRPVQYPDYPEQEWAYSLNHLLKLRDLGIKYEEPLGTYEFEQVVITPMLSVRHGHRAAKGYSNGILTAEQLGHSVVLGHTHRQSIVRKTLWNSITNTWNVITAIEAGAMCKSPGGLGFATAGVPDWQPGFATVTRWPDGGFSFDLATYEQEGTLRWRDQVYST